MKICPVCNDSFTDELNFCDLDGARLTREDSPQDRNKWWSLLGAGLLVGALVISAASIFLLPKSRVSSPMVTSEPPPATVPPKTPAAESAANVAGPAATPEPESALSEAAAPELKKKDKALANSNVGEPAPNPKAAALAAEGVGNGSSAAESNKNTPPSQPEPPAVKTVDTRAADTPPRPQPPPEIKREQKTQPAVAKTNDKASNDKKKSDDKDKKKGGFLKVFKKIFGKD